MSQQPDKLLPAVYGGIIMGLISAVPFVNLVNCICCAGILFGGAMAVYFYKSNFTPDTPPFTTGDCLVVGALAGFVGAIVGAALSYLLDAIFGNIVLEFMRNLLLNSDLELTPEMRDKLEEALTDQDRHVFALMLQFFFSLVLNMVFGLLGGLIGYGIFKPKTEPLPPMPKPL